MSRTNERTLEFNGVTHTLGDWARLLGITHAVLYKRVTLGWSAQEVLTTPVGEIVVSKTEAERALNEMVKNQLPKQLLKLIPEDIKTINLGSYLREFHRKEFNLWFEKVFVPNHKLAKKQ